MWHYKDMTCLANKACLEGTVFCLNIILVFIIWRKLWRWCATAFFLPSQPSGFHLWLPQNAPKELTIFWFTVTCISFKENLFQSLFPAMWKNEQNPQINQACAFMVFKLNFGSAGTNKIINTKYFCGFMKLFSKSQLICCPWWRQLNGNSDWKAKLCFLKWYFENANIRLNVEEHWINLKVKLYLEIDTICKKGSSWGRLLNWMVHM